MSAKLYKSLLGVIALILMGGVSVVERSLNHEREELGLTRYTELKGAPPVLALTTVALGGFRGLISNALWIRANDLQEEGKYFEMVQLADWITKLEPHFTQVWLVQGWNMAYNISVKFKDAPDRWRWVQRGIELLRDQGLQYNPNDVLIHRELAWFFQHKMGANLDDANLYYKQMWANEMSKIFGMDPPNWEALIHPKTQDEIARATLLKEKFKMDPEFMKMVDEKNGPLEWRLPEAHAIYWAEQGLAAAKRNERKTEPEDLITLRRVVYQSMQLSVQRGRLVANKADKQFEFGPNLAIVQKTSAAYERAMDEDPKNRDHIETAHRNLLRDVVYLLYTHNRLADAAQWFKYLGEKYPNKGLIDGDASSVPRNITLDDYALRRIQGETEDMNQDKTIALLEGLVRTALLSQAVGEEDRYIGYDLLARKVWERYMSKMTSPEDLVRRPIPPLPTIRQDVLQRLLDDELSPELAAQLRTARGMPMPTATTNAPAIEPAKQ
ncbi:MAG: hypothetical protein JWR19_3197 [Pedosphaera sp.]|nr:hypothetical protein [Pedosphaera sp.]